MKLSGADTTIRDFNSANVMPQINEDDNEGNYPNRLQNTGPNLKT